MTPQERDAFISDRIKEVEREAYERGAKEQLQVSQSYLEKEIEAARIEGYQRGLKDGDSCTAKSMEIARDAGLEEAANVAEEFEDVNTQDYYGEEIAKEIRSLKSEGK